MANEIDTVVMSGGAPQSPLMAGFLYEVLRAGKTFKNFYTSGAGGLMALLAIAPKGNDPCKALKAWVEAGVADEVYAGLPVNFKLFRKPGPFSPLFHFMAERFKVPRDGVPSTADDPVRDVVAEFLATPRPTAVRWPKNPDALDRLQDRVEKMWDSDPDPTRYKQLRARADPIKRLRDSWLKSWLKDDSQRRVYNDLVELAFSAMTPSTLTYKSKGLAAPLPFLEDIVCFKKAQDFGDLGLGAFTVNAYNMTLEAKKISEDPANWKKKKRADKNQEVMWLFGSPIVKKEWQQRPLDGDHIRAAFSMPFIYPPARIGDDYFSEGADHQPINFHTLAKGASGKAVLLDVLAELEDLLVRTPRDLWDAYVISVMTPVVALARGDIQDFKDAKEKDHNVELIVPEWKIPPEFKAYVMDWSYSNLDKLFEAGQEAGKKFLATPGVTLLDYDKVFDTNRGWDPNTHPPKPATPPQSPAT